MIVGPTPTATSSWLVVGLLLACVGGTALPVSAQELFCQVSVDYRQVEGNEFEFLDDLDDRIEEYLNERRWTEDRFLDFERIDCSLNIIIEEALSLTSFQAQLVLTVRRPIYGTMQKTQLVRIRDNSWRFNYTQGAPLVFDPQQYDPLTSVLDFYAYLILGYDYDSFSELGGTRYFEQARRIADLGQSRGGVGWSSIGSDHTRTILITELLDPRLRPLRRAYYAYHLRGLDRFVSQTEEARTTVLEQLEHLQELYDQVGRQYAVDLFFNTKYQELAALFAGAPRGNQAYNLLTVVDPSHLSEYNRILEE